MKILVTAGPTREYIDDIRFISNPASGLMGLELAKEAFRHGDSVTLVYGPVKLDIPPGVEALEAVSARDMTETVLQILASDQFDVLISTAAIADYTPCEKTGGKIRSGGELTLKLKPTVKLLGAVRQKHHSLMLVGFKAEYGGSKDEILASARQLLEKYSLTLVCANDVSEKIFGADSTSMILVSEKSVYKTGTVSKSEAARKILDFIRKASC
ncbi:MAG TPA: hypothetical protein ENN13_02470 [Candidatus Altiarchaeales archaeon]|nr:hypothetical protein [Candidatus Altiarchaeales archaeon]